MVEAILAFTIYPKRTDVMKYFYLIAYLITFSLNAGNQKDLVKFAETGSCPGGELGWEDLTEIINQLRERGINSIDLRGANLYKADFSGALLQNANFEEACIYEANFTNADCRNANFTKAFIHWADFTNADLTGAIFSPEVVIGIKQ